MVFKAESKQTGERVVLRVIYNSEFGALKSLPRIQSPYISQTLEVFQDGTDVVTVERFIDGVTIGQMIKNGVDMNGKDIERIFIQMCYALSAIHSENIIHRDIKPSNIMLQSGDVVLIDFDVAREHSPERSDDTVYMGTKGYASPEQYGFAQTDNRSDIFSLGVVMKELLGNRFKSVEFERIINKCTQLDPKNRYQSVNELLLDLKVKESPPGNRRENPNPSINSIDTINSIKTPVKYQTLKTVLKIIGYSVFGLYGLLILLSRYPQDITVYDYIASKVVNLCIITLIFAPLLNIFKIWNRIPLMKDKRIIYKILGFLLYVVCGVIFILLIKFMADYI